MEEFNFYLYEDLKQEGDITSDALLTDEQTSSIIIAHEACIVAGLEEAYHLFINQGCTVELKKRDGDSIEKETIIAQVSGPARSILKVERLVLNIIGRMSGIATATHNIVTLCAKINKNIMVMATRKTTPGFRKFEKKAVIIAGGQPHRYGLYDAVLIKDTHLKIVGAVETAIEKIQKKLPEMPIEIEVESKEDALKAAQLKVDIIMLDNFSAQEAEKTTQLIRNISPATKIECSGGINTKNIQQYAHFADRISLGCLTHSVKNCNFSLKII